MGFYAVPEPYSEEDLEQSLQELLESVKTGDYLTASTNCSVWIQQHEFLVKPTPPGRRFRVAFQCGLGFNRVSAVIAAMREAESILHRGSRPEEFGREEPFRIKALPHIEEALVIRKRNKLD